MNKTDLIDNKSKVVKVKYPKGAKYFSYGFFLGIEGQEYLKVIKKKGYKIACICNGESFEIPLYVAEYTTSYVIRNYKNEENNKSRHTISCPRNVDKEEKAVQIPQKKEENSIDIIRSEDFVSQINFKANDFLDTDNKFKNKEYKPNEYASMFRQGEVLLSLTWENYVLKEGKLPKEGNLLHTFYNEIVPKVILNNEIPLSDIIYSPTYKKIEKDEIKDITELLKKAAYSIYKKGRGDKSKGYFMYVLAKLSKEVEVDENTIALTLTDPYKKGIFVVHVKKDYYNRQHGFKSKILSADYYVSCLVSTDYKVLKIEKMATLPVIKDRGCFVQNGKEIELAESIISKNKLFIKPPQALKDFGSYIPDFVLLNRERKAMSIVEVFAFKSESYKKEVQEKIKFFSKQKELRVLFWKANEGETIPEL
jgi:hypothetical protein